MNVKQKPIGARPINAAAQATSKQQAADKQAFLEYQAFKQWQTAMQSAALDVGATDDAHTDDDSTDSAASQYIAEYSAMLPDASPLKSPVLDDTTTDDQQARAAERKQSVVNGQHATARADQQIEGISRNIGKGSGPSSLLVKGDMLPYVKGTAPKLCNCPQHDESKSKVAIPEKQNDGTTKTVNKSCNLHDLTNAVVKPILTSVPCYRLAIVNEDGTMGDICAELIVGANKGDTLMLKGKLSVKLPVADETGKGFVVFEQATNALANCFIRTSRNKGNKGNK